MKTLIMFFKTIKLLSCILYPFLLIGIYLGAFESLYAMQKKDLLPEVVYKAQQLGIFHLIIIHSIFVIVTLAFVKKYKCTVLWLLFFGFFFMVGLVAYDNKRLIKYVDSSSIALTPP